MSEEKFGDFNEFDLIDEQCIELTFNSGQQSKFESVIDIYCDRTKHFRGEVQIVVSGSTW